MSVTGCPWLGCGKHGPKLWCDEHYRMLPHHLRVRIAQGEDVTHEAVAWIRATFDGGPRERWDPGKWERLVRMVREKDAARARRRAALSSAT